MLLSGWCHIYCCCRGIVAERWWLHGHASPLILVWPLCRYWWHHIAGHESPISFAIGVIIEWRFGIITLRHMTLVEARVASPDWSPPYANTRTRTVTIDVDNVWLSVVGWLKYGITLYCLLLASVRREETYYY